VKKGRKAKDTERPSAKRGGSRSKDQAQRVGGLKSKGGMGPEKGEREQGRNRQAWRVVSLGRRATTVNRVFQIGEQGTACAKLFGAERPHRERGPAWEKTLK